MSDRNQEALEKHFFAMAREAIQAKASPISSIESFFESDQHDFNSGLTITLDNGKVFDLIFLERRA